MTHFPDYLKTYPNVDTPFPLHIDIHALPRGFRAHRHDFLELSYVIAGKGSEVVNNVRHEMVPGTFTFVQPYQVHELFTEPGSTLQLYNCMFSMDLLIDAAGQGDGLAELIEPSALPPYTAFTGAMADRMRFLIDDMMREYKGNEPWRLALLQARLKELLVCFDRERRKQLHAEEAPQAALKPRASAWPIIHHIHRNYQEDITLTQLSELFGMSASRISEVIKEKTGQTFVHFLQDLRLRHASSLLISTDFSVVQVALEVGFGSYKTFAKIFRERKGLAPLAYRKAKRSV
ncbi:AraC family transcriptional regulator [Paenibacillus sacheonensis]|uniref:Helix-turn-helix domain-containing protein n=1 Tax=Paenibacillus sacheonensis TaxID=742054 RepID=A0A7X4YQ43_9BACL|nr:AraC family transcriptional regulator [Paenibacillus sacheonensis]MBM7565572.1 AraC-like DNA-binding protein [Paenibacillus sacheonensis]NBC69509.1 helix-turn-helix domain-containing protein [Paenibacillus sacheonensis]